MNAWQRFWLRRRPVRPGSGEMLPVEAGRVLVQGRLRRVAAFQLDRRPVTNAEFGAFLRDRARERPPWMHQSGFGEPEQPIVGVTYDDAWAYARWAGKRLPTESEWLRAARADHEWLHPWGDTPCDAGRCDFSGAKRGAPTAVEPPARAMGCGPFGHHDLLGCVWEWCDGAALRGGFWGAARPTLVERLVEPPDRRSAGYGFRCAR